MTPFVTTPFRGRHTFCTVKHDANDGMTPCFLLIYARTHAHT